MENLIKELEQAKKECSSLLSIIEPYHMIDGDYNWDQESVFEKETLRNRFNEYQDMKSKIEYIKQKIKEKQERIDKFATAQLNGLMSKSPCSSEWFEKNSLKDVWDIAEAMEAERETRINKLNK